MKKYQIIYADPPWSYFNGGVPETGVDVQYQTMKLSDIKVLPISEISDNPSILFLWATFPQLREALEVINAWGFQYKTLGFSWLKINKDGSPFFGIGYYTKSNQEVCLLAVFPEKLAEYFIKGASKEGDTVLDPFMGTGTVGVSCKKLNRKFIGIDISNQYCEIAKKRIGEN